MNEITQIHLGRQAFTISVDAHKLLRDYLAAVKAHTGGGDEVVEEVEIRMAELLLERGITGDKVVLASDVAYLKSQLGEPGDFDDDDDSSDNKRAKSERDDTAAPRRLFRDKKHGLIAGVAAGIAAYFGTKPVVVRLVFVLVLLSGFGGLFKTSLMGGFWLMVLVYIALWVAIPEAQTGSERLQMQGKPVTVDAIKEVVERADVKTAVTRIQQVVESVAAGLFRIIVVMTGFGLTLAGIAGLLAATVVGVYWALNHDLVPGRVFPVGTGEVVLVCLGFVVGAVVALFFIITGLAVVRRKWPLPGWGLGAIVAVFLASLAVGGALAADAVPKVQDRYQAAQHAYVRTLPVFDTLHVLGDSWVRVRYEHSATYSVVANYWGDAPFSGLQTSLDGNTLTVDTRPLTKSLQCRKLCLLSARTAEIVVRAPGLQAATAELQGSQLDLADIYDQTIKVRAIDSNVMLTGHTVGMVQAAVDKDGVWTVRLGSTGDPVDPSYTQGATLYDRSATIMARNIDLTFDGTCGVTSEPSTGPSIQLGRFSSLTVNGEKIGSPTDLRAAYDKPGSSAAKCASLQDYLTDNL